MTSDQCERPQQLYYNVSTWRTCTEYEIHTLVAAYVSEILVDEEFMLYDMTAPTNLDFQYENDEPLFKLGTNQR